jgi:hypothetical protein
MEHLEECILAGETEVIGDNLPLCPSQIPHEMTRDGTWSATVGSRRLTVWVMARPTEQVSLAATLYSLAREVHSSNLGCHKSCSSFLQVFAGKHRRCTPMRPRLYLSKPFQTDYSPFDATHFEILTAQSVWRQATGWRAKFDHRQSQEIFLYSTASSLAL